MTAKTFLYYGTRAVFALAFLIVLLILAEVANVWG